MEGRRGLPLPNALPGNNNNNFDAGIYVFYHPPSKKMFYEWMLFIQELRKNDIFRRPIWVFTKLKKMFPFPIIFLNLPFAGLQNIQQPKVSFLIFQLLWCHVFGPNYSFSIVFKCLGISVLLLFRKSILHFGSSSLLAPSSLSQSCVKKTPS